MEKFKIRDIYGIEYIYNCENKEYIREYFDIKNGEDNFLEFVEEKFKKIIERGEINGKKIYNYNYYNIVIYYSRYASYFFRINFTK